MKMNRLGNWLPRASAWTTTCAMLGLAMAACITRPVGTQPPTTKVNFTSTQSQQAVDKVDLLFAIDNSASMGDKQTFLAEAVPNLLTGLLFPHCVDPNNTDTQAPTDPTGTTKQGLADPVGTKENHYGCPSIGGVQYDAEFKPVTDLHIGIVSSSLGTMGGELNTGVGGDLCPISDATRHFNDNGHLLDRALPTDTGGAAAVAAATPPASFLAWFPESQDNTSNTTRHPTPSNPINNAANLQSYFQSLVLGTAQDGCGLEAQLESMYRFLIQPDPYVRIRKDQNNKAIYDDTIDYDLLAQRALFLRPDSLVAVVMLTDEDDSSADPLAVNGLGFNYASGIFQGSPVGRAQSGSGGTGSTAPLPTKICETDPGNANCTTCGLKGGCAPGDTSAICQTLASDTNCNTTQPGANAPGYYGPDDDDMNVRFYHMKQRYGVDPQFPISRYVNGLSSGRVPDRSTEHTVTTAANGSRNISNYIGTAKCTNPLFASKLPTKQGDEVCNLEKGTRDASLVFFAIVGGVPNQLIYGVQADGVTPDYIPGDPDHNAMTDAKWNAVLGKNPLLYDYAGVDPHMIQSVAPRAELAAAGSATSPRGSNGTDPIIGRDWATNKHDLQYACTFDLPAPTDCNADGSELKCDCNKAVNGVESNQPLCQAAGTNIQIKAKAYPTVRELEVARALGQQGITASLCPIAPDATKVAGGKAAPTYGYNPAVASIIDRLKNALTQQCLPQSLRDLPDSGTPTDQQLDVPCLILAQLSKDTATSSQACPAGLEEPDPAVLKVFQEQQALQAAGSTTSDLATRKVCTVKQLPVQPGESCKTDSGKFWCYVENGDGKKPAGRCQQAIVFSSGTQDLSGAVFSLQCIRQFSAGAAAGDTANTSH